MDEDVYDQAKTLLDDLQCDAALKNTREWPLVEDRYQENLDALKELIEYM